MKSIRRWLLGWLIFGFAAMSAVAGLGIFQKAREEASELFDYELRTVALSMPADVQGAIAAEHSSSDGLDSIADDRLSIEIWNQAGQLLSQAPDSPPPERFPPGIRTARRGAAIITGACSASRSRGASCRSRNRCRCATISRCASRGIRCGRCS